MRTKNKGNQDISKRNPTKYTINQIRGEGRTYNTTDHGAKRKNCDFALMPQSNNRNNLVDFSTDEEKTEVIYGEENVTNWALQRLSTISNTLDLCGDRYGPSIIVANEPIMQKYIELHKRGVRQRSITEITPENIAYCKELMKFQELRHLDGLRGYLSIADGRIVSTHAFGGERGLPHAVESMVRIFVEQQQYFFETLWNKAIPADQKIMEIEEGIEPEVIETIRDPTATQARTIEMIKSAKKKSLSFSQHLMHLGVRKKQELLTSL